MGKFAYFSCFLIWETLDFRSQKNFNWLNVIAFWGLLGITVMKKVPINKVNLARMHPQKMDENSF